MLIVLTGKTGLNLRKIIYCLLKWSWMVGNKGKKTLNSPSPSPAFSRGSTLLPQRRLLRGARSGRGPPRAPLQGPGGNCALPAGPPPPPPHLGARRAVSRVFCPYSSRPCSRFCPFLPLLSLRPRCLARGARLCPAQEPAGTGRVWNGAAPAPDQPCRVNPVQCQIN